MSKVTDIEGFEHSLRDPSLIDCPECGGAGVNDCPAGWTVLVPDCALCKGARVIKADMVYTGPHIEVTFVEGFKVLLKHKECGSYRQRLITGRCPMDGSDLSGQRLLEWGAKYEQSRKGLIGLCRSLKIPFSFKKNQNLLIWIIGHNEAPICTSYAPLVLEWGEWCKRCGHKAIKH